MLEDYKKCTMFIINKRCDWCDGMSNQRYITPTWKISSITEAAGCFDMCFMWFMRTSQRSL